MKLEVHCAKYNGNGASVRIENDEEDCLEISCGYNYTAKYACELAAGRLREAANRLDILARDPEPFKITTHQRINAMRRGEIK